MAMARVAAGTSRNHSAWLGFCSNPWPLFTLPLSTRDRLRVAANALAEEAVCTKGGLVSR